MGDGAATCCKHYPECDAGSCDCGSPCGRSYYATPGEPCWGRVEIVGEDWDEEAGDAYEVHACEGHADELGHGMAYVRETACAGDLPAQCR